MGIMDGDCWIEAEGVGGMGSGMFDRREEDEMGKRRVGHKATTKVN